MKMEKDTIDSQKLEGEGNLNFDELPAEMKVNVIISDILTTIDRLVDMRFALNKILAENPQMGGASEEPHIHDENCDHEDE